jgi:hypothetical protein
VTVETVFGVQTMKWSKNEYVRTIGRPFDRPSFFHYQTQEPKKHTFKNPQFSSK